MDSAAKPDWVEWAQIPRAEDWKAVALSLGIDPHGMQLSKQNWMHEVGGPRFQPETFPTDAVKQEFNKRLRIARANAGAMGAAVELLEGDWFGCVPGRTFELIVSNPPYVAPGDPALEGVGVRFEPRQALVAAEEGLACLAHIARAAPRHLVPGGWLLLEHGAGQGGAVRAELVASGFAQVRSHRDLAGRERMTEGEWPIHR